MTDQVTHPRLEVPFQEQRAIRQKEQTEGMNTALQDMKKVIKSKKMNFVGGPSGLQVKRTCTIQSHLALVIWNGCKFVNASECAAEVHSFTLGWGERQLYSWTHAWVRSQNLSKSHHGCHVKKFLWFTTDKLIPSAVEKYLQHLIDEEMSNRLKKYLELKLFPCIHMKICCLILVAHDKMTAQTNNDHGKLWVLDDEHRLKKKGASRGMYQSSVICSTIGHLEEAGQSLKYGKNYEGYWMGKLFVKQVYIFLYYKKIISTFKCAYSAGYQALFLINNSQGHSVYAEDTLVISHMNIKLRGKQAHMCDRWFIHNGQIIPQPMVFPSNHFNHPNQSKDIKAVLMDGLFSLFCSARRVTLKTNLPLTLMSVSIKTICLWEHHLHH
ncbi:hypothetical protein F5I97DRAFT_1934816 [Phlebopus sp. FC_14]|nr:hypothetical protein F5I97DRAFT_1934816 [Phlebopus sp. FC_14]